ncbi:hypothetical protein M407DRAFT_34504 [Tulasnella calospora MUT 4182]|uniref:Protein kinase domain-containing protein n=1 Tax=Tulasnella calospora MUT 4182 TaxID=1051891 RepID=A0A0C3Q176_9AGAM|nr:hypothetical protein M407DRAFT_34504 [Tulasnella calospora MUT 4182]
MAENTHENEQVHQQLSSQASVTEKVDKAMPRLRICPRKALGGLAHLRIERTRIKPIESRAPKRGGNADVEAAILTPSRPSNSSKPEVTEYVAVKKLRFDSETDHNRALAPFAHEVGLLNDLSHPNVVNTVGFVEDVDDGVAWLVFTWEKNGNLREFVRSANWELPERVSLVSTVLAAPMTFS